MVVRVRKRVGALGFEAALGRLVEEGLVRFSSFVLRKDGDHKAVVPLPAGLAAVVVADQAVTVHGALFGVEGESMSAVRTATFQLAFPRTPQGGGGPCPPRSSRRRRSSNRPRW